MISKIQASNHPVYIPFKIQIGRAGAIHQVNAISQNILFNRSLENPPVPPGVYNVSSADIKAMRWKQ